MKEAQARIKINKLLEQAGWRFFDEGKQKANIICEDRISKKILKTDDLGNNFEEVTNGFVDYVLLDSNNEPIAVVEAKRENIDPLSAIDQAKVYAKAKRVRHIFLSNGLQTYYLDSHQMTTVQSISSFFTLKQLGEAEKWQPNPEKMATFKVDENFIAIAQDSRWLHYDETMKAKVKIDKPIKILRDYQIAGIKKLQLQYCKEHKRRFLFEMATGTGKTLLAAGIIRLFLASGCANRVLFLVDRIELEDQAAAAFKTCLENEGRKTVIYKEARNDWQNAQIVVTTIQSLATNGIYRKLFNPTDFQLIISDEAHRTISGNNRAIFEYFIGTRIGLTATPKNYLKGINIEELKHNDPRQAEQRSIRDTYKTFGCEDGIPTFQFNLNDGVKAGILCNPYVIDARTDITTELLGQEGFEITYTDEEGEEVESTYFKKDYEKKFSSEETNRTFVKTFLQHAKKDPLTHEIGKTILFAVSRKHATRLTQILNEEINLLYPQHYKNAVFAKQITSDIATAHQSTELFSHEKNDLEGKTQFNSNFEEYFSSRTRVCVTVGMMTTGYDCQDLLNIVLCRPIMSPTEFIQIKGRGTRLYTFAYNKTKKVVRPIKKDTFFLFDFFGNYEYFEKEFQYDKKIKLPKAQEATQNTETNPRDTLNYTGNDDLAELQEIKISDDGMRIDREMFTPIQNFEEQVKSQVQNKPELKKAYEEENWDFLVAYIKKEVFDKPKEFWNIDKLCDEYDIDRRLTTKEILMKVFGKIDKFQTRTELAEEEFALFLATVTDEKMKQNYEALQNLFQCYLLYADIQIALREQNFGIFATDNRLSLQEIKELGIETVKKVSNYIIDNNINKNHFIPRKQI
jgi:type I restriction enzyme R subunit